MRLRARNLKDGARDGFRGPWPCRALRPHPQTGPPLVRQAERAVEVVVSLPCLHQAFGLEPFEVGQVAQGGEAERLQEFPRRHIGERRAGLRGADRAVDQSVALEGGDDVAADLAPASFEISPRVTGCR